MAKSSLGQTNSGRQAGSGSVAHMLGIDDAMGRANRMARLIDEDQPLGRVGPDGPVDRLLRPAASWTG